MDNSLLAVRDINHKYIVVGEMNVANVVFTEPAEYDLLDIEYYIFVDLCNPQAAQRISDGILDAAEKLSEYPTAHPLIDDELLRSVGL